MGLKIDLSVKFRVWGITLYTYSNTWVIPLPEIPAVISGRSLLFKSERGVVLSIALVSASSLV